MFVCKACGFIGFDGHCIYCSGLPSKSNDNPFQAVASKPSSNMCSLKMPYASKLMLQELQAMNIRTQIKLRDD